MSLKNLFGKKEAPAACGTACGAGDKKEEKPAACGTACGAGDKQNLGQFHGWVPGMLLSQVSNLKNQEGG